MPQILIHKDGAWNIFSTVVDAPVFEHAITYDDLKYYWYTQYGATSIMNFIESSERAKEHGTSSPMEKSIKNLIICNRAGPRETYMPYKEFMKKFMTLPDPYEPDEVPEKVQQQMDAQFNALYELRERLKR